jgi:hypothetical protein
LIGQQMADNFACGLGDVKSDSVFLRSYSALGLCMPVAVDQLFALGHIAGREPFLTSERVAQWCAKALTSLQGENDLRGFVEGKGWADAVSHMSDALCGLARSPHSHALEHEKMLNAIAELLIRPSDTAFVTNEGSRLMRVVYHVLLRGELRFEDFETWLKRFSQTSDGRNWGWMGIYSLEFCDYRALTARANACEALRSLYFLLKLGLQKRDSSEPAVSAYYEFYDRPIPYREELMNAIVSALRPMYGGLYPQE